MQDGTIKIFSRNSEDMTAKYPELVDFSKFYKNKDDVQSLIIDGEIVAYDVVEDKILPFQILTTRKRKNVEIDDIKVKVCIYVFDILSLNGESLLEKTLEERRKIYMDVFETKKGELQFANNLITDDEAEISAFWINLFRTNVRVDGEGFDRKKILLPAGIQIQILDEIEERLLARYWRLFRFDNHGCILW